MNPLAASTVAAYEAWNIQYATLTDKAAKDFSPIPGLAESVGGLGRTARPGRTRCGRASSGPTASR